MEKNKRIKKELSRISIFFDDIAENQRAIVSPLLQNAAFMKVTLEDLQEEINANGPTDEYKNGNNQFGVKQSATLQSYNALIKNYASVIKTLSQLLPVSYRKALPEFSPKIPHEKTDEEMELEERLEEEKRRRINAEIARADEILKRQREEKDARMAIKRQ